MWPGLAYIAISRGEASDRDSDSGGTVGHAAVGRSQHPILHFQSQPLERLGLYPTTRRIDNSPQQAMGQH